MCGRCSEYGMTSDDFRNWTETAEVLCADEQMPVPGGEPVSCRDFYTPAA